MNQSIRILLVGLLSTLLCACATRPKMVHSPADLSRIIGKPPEDKVTLFVHLPSLTPTISGTLLVDDRAVCQMPNGSFTKLVLPSGTHTINFKFPAITGPKCEACKHDFEKGVVNHLALVSGPRNNSLGNMLVDGLLYHLDHVELVYPTDGIRLMYYEKFIDSGDLGR